ncbi:HEPN domain-containing protein [Candidatus Micrarchaeota archaeon]|nr:HEPN domain-containing protein [Candidatus Micrarchaeota archaeon]
MRIDECVAQGLLKKMSPDKGMAMNSVRAAEHKLGIAKREMQAKIYENAVISAYTSMFHAARAILYRDGFKERSHYAISVYLKEKYGEKIEKRFVYTLDTLRSERHEIMYGLNEPLEISAEEAKDAILTAADFVEAVKKMI